MAHLRISIITISLLLPTLNIIGCEEKAQNSSTFRQDLIREFSPDKSFLSSEEFSKIKDVPQAFIEQYILRDKTNTIALELALKSLTPEQLATLESLHTQTPELVEKFDEKLKRSATLVTDFAFSSANPDQSTIKLLIKNTIYSDDFFKDSWQLMHEAQEKLISLLAMQQFAEQAADLKKEFAIHQTFLNEHKEEIKSLYAEAFSTFIIEKRSEIERRKQANVCTVQ